jgi:hypothetical protein
MTEEQARKERRVCRRFQIPGATVNYTLRKNFSPDKKDDASWEEEFCPLRDISCGGVRYVGKKILVINTEIVVKIFIPGERNPLTFLGEVRWLSTEDDKKTCEMGVQFNPYGEGEGKNYPGLLVKLMELEHKFSSQDSDISKFEIDT